MFREVLVEVLGPMHLGQPAQFAAWREFATGNRPSETLTSNQSLAQTELLARMKLTCHQLYQEARFVNDLAHPSSVFATWVVVGFLC